MSIAYDTRRLETRLFTQRDLEYWRAANHVLWRPEYWHTYVDDRKHYDICMNSNGWFPRKAMPYISPSDQPQFRLLYASYFWKSLLSYLGLPPINGTVLELLPGKTLTVSIALESLGFRGIYDRLDLSSYIPSCSTMQYSSHTLQKNVFELGNKPLSYDLIIGNHIIDDLLLDLALRESNQCLDHNDSSSLNDVWRHIFESDTYEHHILLILNLFDRMLKSMKHNAVLILRHYPSTFELRSGDMTRLRFLKAVFHHISSQLKSPRFGHSIQLPVLDVVAAPTGEKFPSSIIVAKPNC